MTKQDLVSICIPSYNRPLLLKEALESCFAQTYQDYEILIGDDSKDTQSEAIVVEMEKLRPSKIKYIRNIPPLKQNANIDMLFKRASGDRLVLLHDDDLLLPNALSDLSACWTHTPDLTAAFGLQTVITMDGRLMDDATRRTNEFYLRTKENFGLLRVPALAGLLRMFPNNGYMVLTKHAQKIGYRPRQEVGGACEYDFGLRYCLDNAKIYLIDKVVSVYRISDDAMSRSSNDAPDILRIVKQVKVPPEAEVGQRAAIRYFAPRAASGYARKGNGVAALQILISSDYAWKDRLSPKFLLHCMLTLAALLNGQQGVTFVVKFFKGKVRQ